MVGVLPRPMSRARQPPRPARVEEAEPGQRLGLVAAQLAVEALGRRRRARCETVDARASRSAAQPPPSTLMPPASGEPSRPRAWRSISAPVSWVVDRPARPGPRRRPRRSAWSSSTQRPPERTSGRASAASRAMSAAVSSTSSNTRRPAHVGELVGADHGLASAARRSAAATGWPCLRDSAGTRTSKPADTSTAPVSVMSSQASSWLRTTSPRRLPPGRCSGGQQALEAGQLLLDARGAAGRR